MVFELGGGKKLIQQLSTTRPKFVGWNCLFTREPHEHVMDGSRMCLEVNLTDEFHCQSRTALGDLLNQGSRMTPDYFIFRLKDAFEELNFGRPIGSVRFEPRIRLGNLRAGL